MSLATKVLRLIPWLVTTLSDTITLLIIELYHSVKPLINKFLIFITCRVKTRFVLKKCSSDILTCKFFFTKKFLVNRMFNRLEYGVQIRSIHASFSFIKKNIASKKQVENNFLKIAITDKPFLIRKYVISPSSALSKLRRRCYGIYPAYFLVDFFVKTKTLSREFSVKIEIESHNSKCSILEDLIRGK
jgi:hypothetical protein